MRPNVQRCLRLYGDMGDTARSFLRVATMSGPSWYIWSHKGETHLLPPGSTIGTSGMAPEVSSVGRVLMRFPVDSHYIIASAAGLVAANGWLVVGYGVRWVIDPEDRDEGRNEAWVAYTRHGDTSDTLEHSAHGPCPHSAALSVLVEIEQHNQQLTGGK